MAGVGDVLGGRYRLERPLGAGGMGQVFAARDELLDRDVAVKLPATRSTRAVERFQREARAAARLNHPHVVSVYDWGEVDAQTPFIVMELVSGRSLRELLAARRVLPPAEVAEIGAQIGDALVAAHEQGIVHRDVKPSNVLITNGGVVKVTDFGISKSLDAVPEALTEPGGIVGTPGYLAPEQRAGFDADVRTDVYALGVVLGELLTGARDTTIDARADSLDAIVARARAEDPSARYQHVDELRDALRALARTAATVTIAAKPIASATVPPLDTVPTQRAVASAAPPLLVPAVPAPAPLPAPAGAKTRREHKREAKAARRALHLRAKSQRRWRARHVAAMVAAPLVAAAAGVLAYTEFVRAPSVRVPGVVHRDVFAAAYTLTKAGFEVDSVLEHDPRPAGTVLAQSPRRGVLASEGSHVTITISDVMATMPDVVGASVDDALAALRHAGLVNVALKDDYRDDEEAGTVVGSTPAAYSEASKKNTIELVVARDPHVSVPNLVGVDQATATSKLQALGLDVAVKTANSRTVASGLVISESPSADRVVLRGSTVTLTVSSGARLVLVPYVVGRSADDAMSELDDAGFAVSVSTAPVPNNRVGDVISQDPPGGQAAEGSTVKITVGVRSR